MRTHSSKSDVILTVGRGIVVTLNNVQGPGEIIKEADVINTETPECPAAQQPAKKNPRSMENAIFKLIMWYIFGIAVSFLAVGLAAAFDYYLGYNIQTIKINRISDFLLALLATSSGLVNVLIEAKRPRSLNCKILLAIIPVVTIFCSLGFYCFLYERNVDTNIAGNDLLFLASLWVLLVYVCIGTGLILVSEKRVSRK